MSSNSTSSKETKQQPPWIQPQGKPLSDLMVYNSLTQTKVPFIAKNGKNVTWYICGPTVYDSSHMGHARNYVGFDIIRRILSEYFGYNVFMVMNITDIDDKIIVRSKEQVVEFTELARAQENSFHEDMRALKVQPPDVLTRVSEYVPEVIRIIEGIIKNGFAYESNKSVYFDVTAFSAKHHYAKLSPWSVGDAKLAEEGEGSLSSKESEKRSPNDFALWKKSKDGEPKWISPWGEGRPGWHIECSAMAIDILGETLDIHSGGEDLRFPHHDNEIAQSEAFFKSEQWVNYFIHSGHLHIEGKKMSKSLKNFIKIKDALEKYDARQIRLLFLLHKYDEIMDYGNDSMTQVLDFDKIFSSFFHNIKGILRKQHPNDVQRWGNNEKELMNILQKTKLEVHSALSDNFNTPLAVNALKELVHKTNKYVDVEKAPKTNLLRSVGLYITQMFKIFGLIDNQEIGYITSDTNVESVLTPVLNALTDYRTRVRSAAREKDFQKVMEASDWVRDDALPPLGVRLSDSTDGTTIWMLDDKATIMKEVALKRESDKKKLEDKLARQKLEQERLEKGKVHPKDMFLNEKDKYSQFDENGIPTHDNEGKPIGKASKALKKEWDKQLKLHEQWKKSQNIN